MITVLAAVSVVLFVLSLIAIAASQKERFIKFLGYSLLCAVLTIVVYLSATSRHAELGDRVIDNTYAVTEVIYSESDHSYLVKTEGSHELTINANRIAIEFVSDESQLVDDHYRLPWYWSLIPIQVESNYNLEIRPRDLSVGV